MPYVSIQGVSAERLEFLGFEKVREDEDFWYYKDVHGRISVADKTKPYIWIDDINDAIQMGSPSIIVKQD